MTSALPALFRRLVARSRHQRLGEATEPRDKLFALLHWPIRQHVSQMCAPRLDQPGQRIAASPGEPPPRGSVTVADEGRLDPSQLLQLTLNRVHPIMRDAVPGRDPLEIQTGIAVDAHEQPRCARRDGKSGTSYDVRDVRPLDVPAGEQL